MSKKAIILIIILAVLGIGVYALNKYSKLYPGKGGLPGVEMPTTNWKTYRNEEYGYEINYPENWNMDVRGGITTLIPSEFTYEDLLAEDVKAEISQTPSAEFIALNKEVNVEEMANAFLKIRNKEESKTTTKLTTDTFQNRKVFILKGFRKDNGNLIGKEILLPRDNIHPPFALTYWTNGVDQRYDQTLDQILSTFKFLE